MVTIIYTKNIVFSKGFNLILFSTSRHSLINRKLPIKHRRPTHRKSLLEHVKDKYDFVWNSATFRLEDENDSVNFGDLVVSPPPSGKVNKPEKPFQNCDTLQTSLFKASRSIFHVSHRRS